MFIVTNKTEAKKRIFQNRLMFWAGVGMLLGSMIVLVITSGLPQASAAIFVFGYPLLIGGVILSKRGAFNNRRFGVGGYKAQPEELVIDDQLKGVPPRYHLYNYVSFGGVTIEHLLVTPQGFIILLMKPQLGKLKAGRDLYRLKRGFGTWLGTVGEPGLGNPSQDLSRQVKRLRSWFEGKGYNIPTDGIVILTNPQTSVIGVADMSFPVCLLKDLRAAVRQWETELNMTTDEQLEVEKLIIQQLPADEAPDAEELLTMPAHKRAQLEAEERAAAEANKKNAQAAKPAKKEPVKERREKAQAGANTSMMPGQRLGMNGKPLPAKPVAEKPRKRASAPLRKPNPGAFGNIDNRKDD